MLSYLFILTSCNFGDGGDDSSGGGLFSNHQIAINKFLLMPSSNKQLIEANTYDLTIQHSYPINVTGNPRITLNLSSGTQYANYLSGNGTKNLTFRYIVQAGDNDQNGIDFDSTIDLNGGALEFLENGVTKAANLDIVIAITPVIKVDTSRPTIGLITPPNPKTYLKDQQLQFLALFSETVYVSGTPTLTLDIGGVSVNATYQSGNNSNILNFKYTVLESDIDLDGIVLSSPLALNAGSIKDEAGNDAILTFTSIPMPTTYVDGDLPYVSGFTPPTNNTYTSTDVLTLTLQFSENIFITGAPRVVANVGGVSRYFYYISGSGSKNIQFQYIAQDGDDDYDGISIANTIELNAGTIKDAGARDANLDLLPPLLPNVKIDAGFAKITNIALPPNGTYTYNDELFFTATFDRNVTITGVPQLQLLLDSHSPAFIYATYMSGSGTDEIVFRYLVQNGELDLTGITIDNSYDLNGGTILAANGVNASLDITNTVSLLDSSNILIDSASASVISITPPVDSNFLTGNNIDFTLNFSKVVNITNTPRLTLDIGGVTKYANYLSGSGSQNIIFRYTVTGADSDTDGITISSPIDLNATGTIKDSSLTDANLVFTSAIPDLTNVFVNKPTAIITSITSPIDALYLETQNLDFIINTNEVVNITGTPRVAINVGGVTKYANYLSGTGSQALTFRYIIENGLYDLDGIQIISPLDLNSGTIKNGSLLDMELTFTAPSMTGVQVNSSNPTVTAITAPLNNNYLTASDLDFTISFSSIINVTNTPRLALTIGSSTLYANYLSGTGTSDLVFRYTVSGLDLDSDGISLSSTIDLNTTGTIKDGSLIDANLDLSSYLPNLTNVFVNKSSAVILSVTPPLDATYLEAENIDFTVNTNENISVVGTPRISINIGGQTKYANYISGSGTTALLFRYTVEPSLDDSDGIIISSPLDLNGGTLKNVGNQDLGLTYTPPIMTNVLVDSILPAITSITAPADATYLETQNLDFIVNTDENIDITGTPRLSINIGGTTKYANYLSGTGTQALTFRYTIESGLSDLDGINLVSPVQLNSGTMKSSSLRDLALTFTSPIMTNVIVDSILPTITSITPPVDATYLETETMDFIVNTDENIDVTGTPRITIDIGGSTKYATYVSGTGTQALLFRYTIEASLSDNDGISITTPLDLNSGSMQNSSLKNLDLNFSAPILSGVLVDSSDPTITITSPADLSYINSLSDSAVFTILGTCSEAGKTVTIEVDGGASSSPSGFLCNGTNFTGTIDTTGLTEATHTFVAKIQDDALNEGISTTITLTKDLTIPIVSSITPPINNWYTNSSNLNFILNFDDNAHITGSPRIQIDINGVTRYATYQSGTGTPTVTFRYTVQSGEEDTNGIGFASTLIDLNSGTILDIAGNPINLNLDAGSSLPNLSSILVDGIVPTVTITSSPDITSANESTYSLTGTCSENGRSVNINIDSLTYSPICSANAWTTGAINISSRLDNPALPITVDHNDVAGNNAIQVSTSVNKDSATPQVAITFAQNINSSNVTSYSISGTCTDVGLIVDINIGALNFQPNCSGGNWTTGYIDVSSLADSPSISITADHNGAIQAITSVAKDTLSATVTISSSPNISLSNETSYILSGTCSNNGSIVDVYIDILNFQPNCSSGSWTTGAVDVSSIGDGTVSVTADHSTATQASVSINKNTSTPTVTSLTVPTTLSNSADLNWTTNDPGGFTLNDYEINYRVKGNPTWLLFSDGVSLNTTSTVTSLIPDTTYEFRVRLLYNTSIYSDWTTTTEGLTKPDIALFNSPYAAMNVGGSTDTRVVAMYDNTRIYLNGVEIAASPISKGVPTSLPAHAQFDIIDADKPIFTAGRRGSGGQTAKANIVWQPTSWAGKTFTFNSTRNNPQQLYVFATEDTVVQVKQGSTVLDSTSVTAGNGAILSWSVYGSYQVQSTGTILAYHSSGDPANTLVDPKPLLPSSLEIIGFPSNSMLVTSVLDSTNYYYLHSNSTTGSGNLNMSSVDTLLPQGATTTLYQSHSLLISADRNISGASFADSNGNCAAPFMPTNLMKKKYMVNTNSDWVAFASKQAGTIDVYSPGQTIGVSTPVQTLTLTRTGGNTNAPYYARLNTTNGGYRFVSSVPMAAWYQPNTDTGASAQDETIMYGTDE